MKKFLYLSSVAALALASCSDDLGLKTDVAQPVEGKYSIEATYPIGGSLDTRTTLEFNNGKFAYAWEDGDAIGVFNAQPTDYTNGMFRYSGQGNIFKGDANVFDEDSYYAYYPYDPQAEVSNSSLTLYIKEYQNYNYQANNLGTWQTAYPNGYFAQGAAPAVALGSMIQGAMSLQFKAVGSYLVFPVTGDINGKIKSFTLTIDGATNGNQELAGALTVNMLDLNNPFKELNPTWSTNVTPAKQVILNAGNNFTLSQTNPVNLWFVVAPDVILEGNTISLTATYIDDTTGAEMTTPAVTRTMPSEMSSPNTVVNDVRWISSSAGTSDPFYFTTVDAYVIRTQQQFLEWSWIATHGVGAAGELYNNGEVETVDSPFAGYCDLYNMLIEESALKPAFLAKDIIFSQSDLEAFLGTNNPEYLSTYLQAIYGQFLTEGSIPTIGGQEAYTIYGNNQSLSNLKIEKVNDTDLAVNGIFAPKSGSLSTIENLSLNNVEVVTAKNSGMYNFFQSTSLAYDNVTVGNDCKITPAATDANAASVTGVFGLMTTEWLEGGKKDVTNNTTYPFAVQLGITSDFNFVKNDANVTINDFLGIGFYPNANSFGSVLTVQDKSAAIDLLKVIYNPNNAYNYSIMNNWTGNTAPIYSYWTGTVIGFVGGPNVKVPTAEYLAWAAQQSDDQTFNLDNNVDLMGDAATVAALGNKFNQYWTAYASLDKVMTVNTASSAKAVTIANVLIDAANLKELSGSLGNTLTTFGTYSYVKNITIDGLTINNVATDDDDPIEDAIIAAVSTSPWVSGVSAVSINNFTVNADAPEEGYVGGLYSSFAQNVLPYIGASSITETTNLGDDMGYGLIAGELAVQLSAPVTSLINNTKITSNYFGNLTVSVTSAQTNNVSEIKVVGFNSGFITANNFVAPTTANGLPTLTNNYTVWVKYYSSATATTPSSQQAFVYNSSNKKWTFQSSAN